MKQRVNIRFCYKLGKTAAETHEMFVQVYGTEAVSMKCVCEWFKRFRDGKETTENEPLSGRPSTSRTPDMIERVRQMLAQDWRETLRLMAGELGISKDTVHTIVCKYFGKQKICSRFVPRKLTDEQKVKLMGISGYFIIMCDQDPSFLRNIVKGTRPGANNSTRNPSDNRWNGVHLLPRQHKRVACKSTRSRQC